MALTLFMSTGQKIGRMFLSLGIHDVSSYLDSSYAFLIGMLQMYSQCIISRSHTTLICCVTGHDISGHLVRVLSARIFYCKVNSFPFCY